MSVPEEGFEDLSTIGMLRHLTDRADRYVDQSPAQVLFIYTHLNLILMSSLADLSELSRDDLFNAQNLIDLYELQRRGQ